MAHQESSLITPIPPAQLWLGFHDHLEQQIISYAQKIFCAAKGCGHCINCTQIAAKQHHAMLWILPEKLYTIDDIAPISSTIAFSLEHNEHYFFILQKSDFLTQACANSLLKSLEEPPAGYHFILLAERADSLLPTIKSRCIIKMFHSAPPLTSSDLYAYFISTGTAHPSSFLATLEHSKISERDSIEMLDAILIYWITALKTAMLEKNEKQVRQAERVITIVEKAIASPPMPGSSKMLWKNLFLQIKSQ